MSQPKSILFVMPNLGGAGAERVVSILLNNLDRAQFTPKLIILKKSGSNKFLNDLKKDVEVISLGLEKRLRFSILKFLYSLIKTVNQESPDILFMGAGTINAFLAPFLFLIPNKTKLVARESNLPSFFEKIKPIRWIYRKFYNNYDLIIAQSDDMVNDLIGNFNVNPLKIKKINNPVDHAFIYSKLKEDVTTQLPEYKINLLAAGRLTHQKGFDILIDNFSKIDHQNIHLTILGEGEEKEYLQAKANRLKLNDKVTFLGNVDNPYKYMQKADIFVLSSRYEGFPNVLLESLVCKCPILANDCPGGIREIVEIGKNGFIYSSHASDFETQLLKLINSGLPKQRLNDDAARKYTVDKIIHKYTSILCQDG